MFRRHRIHQILIKTHKLSVCLTVPPETTVTALKEEALSAFLSDVFPDDADEEDFYMEIPRVSSIADFELCRAKRDRGRITGEYELLENSKTIIEYKMPAWEALFVRFKDSSTGELLPITCVLPPLDDDEEEVPLPTEDTSVNKGKRKAHPDEL